MYGIYWNTVSNVDASDSRCRCIGKIFARDLRLVVSRLYRMAVTVSPSVGADLLGCINRIKDKERKGKHYTMMPRTYSYKLKVPLPIGTAQGDLSADPVHGETPPPID
jgi:hypothetical protein